MSAGTAERAERGRAGVRAVLGATSSARVVRARRPEFEGVNVENAAYPSASAPRRTPSERRRAGYRPGDFEASAQRLALRRLPAVALEMNHRMSFRDAGDRDDESVELLPETWDGAVKSGFVAVAGRPNVGKSTLVNALIGEKVAIVSQVPNTTRRRIFGVANGDDHQLVLLDLPGFQRPIDKLTERMQRTVDTSFEDIDIVSSSCPARPDRRRRPVHRAAGLRPRGSP